MDQENATVNDDSITWYDIFAQVAGTLRPDEAGFYDVGGIAGEIIEVYGLVDIATIPEDEYQTILRTHSGSDDE